MNQYELLKISAEITGNGTETVLFAYVINVITKCVYRIQVSDTGKPFQPEPSAGEKEY